MINHIKERSVDVKTNILDISRLKSEINFSMVNDIHENDSIFRLLTADVAKRKTDFVVFNDIIFKVYMVFRLFYCFENFRKSLVAIA